MRLILSLVTLVAFAFAFAQLTGKPDNTRPPPSEITLSDTKVSFDRAARQIEDAMADPVKAKILKCLGVSRPTKSYTGLPNEAQCEQTLAAASGRSPNYNNPILKNGGVNGSPASREYVATMLNFQYGLELAYHVGICQLRSEAYFKTFQTAQFQLSQQEAKRLRLSGTELSRADAEVNRQFAKAHEGAPQFDLYKGCAFLRESSTLTDLDAMYSRITNNYR